MAEPQPDAGTEKRKVTRAAGVVGLATLASRVGGFVRDLVIAYLFGATAMADAFFVAFRIPNLLRRLFAEGTLTIAFIPVYTEVLHKKGRDEAMLFFRSTWALLSLVLLAVTALGVAFAPWVVRAMAPGFTPGDGTYALAVQLTRWCMPYIFFISLVALAGGVLNSLDHFFAPAVAPLLLNIAMITAALGLAPLVEPPVLSLALGVLAGGVTQLALQIPYLRTRGVPLRPSWDPRNPALRRVLRLMGPAAFGAAVYQLTVFINTVLASLLPTGSVSYLYYADRLIQFPLGIFAFAVATAILPSLSRQAAQGRPEALIEGMNYGLRLTLFVTVPAMAGLVVLAEPIITLLFQRGEFGAATAQATAGALAGYSAGLWAFACLRTVVQTFYALKDTKTPVYVAAACLAVNVGVGLALMGPLAHVGLALATSVSAACNLGALLYILHRRLGRLGFRAMALALARMAVATAAMSAAAALAAYGPDWGEPAGWASRYARPLAGLAAGVAVYLGAAWLLRMEELRDLRGVLARR